MSASGSDVAGELVPELKFVHPNSVQDFRNRYITVHLTFITGLVARIVVIREGKTNLSLRT